MCLNITASRVRSSGVLGWSGWEVGIITCTAAVGGDVMPRFTSAGRITPLVESRMADSMTDASSRTFPGQLCWSRRGSVPGDSTAVGWR